jgi:hypothetical protein
MTREQGQPPSLHSSLTKIRKNKILLILTGTLILTIFAVPSSNRASKELVVLSLAILLVKSESRSQPRSVVGLGILLCALTILGVVANVELGLACDWAAVAVIIPLIFSKWLFVQRSGVPLSG